MATLYRPPPPGPARGRKLRVDGLTTLLAGVLAALLPREPREEIGRRWGVDPPFWSGLIGLIEIFACPLALVGDFMRVVPAFVDQGTSAALAAGFEEHPSDSLAVMWSGAFAWLRWLTSPWTMLLVLLTVTGAVRVVSFALTREAVGEPLVWLGWRLWRGLVRAPARATRDALHFGPARPDRVLPLDDGGLLVLTRDPKEDWNERITIQVGDRFFRLAEAGERQEESWHWHAYRLREEDPTAVIRGLVLYEP